MYSDTLELDISFDVPVRRSSLFSRKMFDVPVRPMDAKGLIQQDTSLSLQLMHIFLNKKMQSRFTWVGYITERLVLLKLAKFFI